MGSSSRWDPGRGTLTHRGGPGGGFALTYIGLVNPPAMSPSGAARLDFDRGRNDDRRALGLALPSAPAGYLLGAMDNPALGPEEVTLILENRAATPEILTRIGRNLGWMRPREAKRALVAHANTPAALSRRFLPHLFWRELADVAGDLRIPPVVRRDAEKLVRLRLPELTLGERVTLARVASRG